MAISRDFEELFELFHSKGVRFVIVGAHAVAHHAKPRYTKDIDVFVEPSLENGRRVIECLEAFGFGGLGLEATDFATPGQVVQLGVPPNRVDLLTAISGVEWAEAWGGRVEGAYGRQVVPYLGRGELIRNKRAAGRPQDRVDLSWLLAGDEDGD